VLPEALAVTPPQIIAPERLAAQTVAVNVVKVFDGDGFLARAKIGPGMTDVEVPVRCGFIDAPEMDQPGGSEARDYLQSLIAHQKLELAVLVKGDTGKIVDRYGRIVAVPYLAHRGPWSMAAWRRQRWLRNVELEMVANGWAWVLERFGPDESYFAALQDAQRNRRGIWTRADNQEPWRHKLTKYSRAGDRTSASGNAANAKVWGRPCGRRGREGSLVNRTGRFGQFLGCSADPVCRNSEDLR